MEQLIAERIRARDIALFHLTQRNIAERTLLSPLAHHADRAGDPTISPNLAQVCMVG